MRQDCYITKDVTLGKDFGKRAGTPYIGDRVFIGAKATIVYGIDVGDDVVISPNTFVNIDVSSNSIALGVPCKIIYRKKASKNFLYNIPENEMG